jgi:hypothetical protein
MAANMINAEAGLTVYVIGKSKAIASAGPIPGKTPTNVPRIVPSRPNIKFVRVKAPAKPVSSDSTLPIKFLPEFQKEDSRLIHV